MKHCIGTFGKALLRNTNALHPEEVEICFEFLKEWICHSGCLDEGLLPPEFCYDTLWNAADHILGQENWEIICVFLSFLLHHSRLFREEFRSKLFEQLLLKVRFVLTLEVVFQVNVFGKMSIHFVFCVLCGD